MLKAGDAVQYNAVEAGVFFERVQAVVQTLWLGQLAVDANGDVAILQFRYVFDDLGIEEVVVLAA